MGKQLQEIEAEVKKFPETYDKFCTHNAAHCSKMETCYVNKRKLGSSGGGVFHRDLMDQGPTCVCHLPFGREHSNGTGACSTCKVGLDGQPAYVTINNYFKQFHN